MPLTDQQVSNIGDNETRNAVVAQGQENENLKAQLEEKDREISRLSSGESQSSGESGSSKASHGVHLGSSIVLPAELPEGQASNKEVVERQKDIKEKILSGLQVLADAAANEIKSRVESGNVDEQELANIWMYMQEQQKAKADQESTQAKKQ